VGRGEAVGEAAAEVEVDRVGDDGAGEGDWVEHPANRRTALSTVDIRRTGTSGGDGGGAGRRVHEVIQRQPELTRVDTSTYVDSMTDATDLAEAAGSTDARTGLRAVLALRRLLEKLEVLQVGNARRQGWSWQDIADALEVSKQAVHKKHAGRERRGWEG